MLNITEVRFKKIGNGNFLGYAGVTISDSIAIREIKLFDSKNGKYIIMPGVKVNGLNKRRHFAFPVTEEARKELLDAIVKKYEEELREEDEEKIGEAEEKEEVVED